MTRRLEVHGHEVKTYDPRVHSTAETLQELAEQLEPPRHVWLMVPSGEITEQTVQELLEVLAPGDTVIDGGNSYFRDSQRRYGEAQKREIAFVDAGVSGGVWGFDVGFCLMVGGDDEPVGRLRPICEALAPENGWAAQPVRRSRGARRRGGREGPRPEVTVERTSELRAFLGRRSRGRRARGAGTVQRRTDPRRARSILQRAASGAGAARLCRAGAVAGEGRA
jgi:hypothetical protein